MKTIPASPLFTLKSLQKGILGPDGKLHNYAPATIEKWYLNYQKHGFDGLIPKGRSDAGMSRKLDDELQERICYFKSNYPRMSAAAIYRQLKSDGSVIHGQVSESTVCRFVNQLQNELRQTPNKDMRRYERPHINEVWCGDSSVGPRLTDESGKKHRVYIIALIDDASRFITGIDVFYNDNFINLLSVMKSAVAKYGRPKVFNFDNGKSYKNKQMELLAARIGSTLSYCQPYTPTGKAKIERWFRTIKTSGWLLLICGIFIPLISCVAACLHLYSSITSPLIPPFMECRRRTGSLKNLNRSAAFPMTTSPKTFFWKSSVASLLTVSSSSTRLNTKWITGSHASASAFAIPLI